MYGTTGRQYVDQIKELATKWGIKDILDYGCGKGDVANMLASTFRVQSYDPAVPGCDALPRAAGMVVCIDVLEHVEPDYLDNVLGHLVQVTKRLAFFTIATGSSSKRLSDGSNCHRIIQTAHWWIERTRNYFTIVGTTVINGGVVIVASNSSDISAATSRPAVPAPVMASK